MEMQNEGLIQSESQSESSYSSKEINLRIQLLTILKIRATSPKPIKKRKIAFSSTWERKNTLAGGYSDQQLSDTYAYAAEGHEKGTDEVQAQVGLFSDYLALDGHELVQNSTQAQPHHTNQWEETPLVLRVHWQGLDRTQEDHHYSDKTGADGGDVVAVMDALVQPAESDGAEDGHEGESHGDVAGELLEAGFAKVHGQPQENSIECALQKAEDKEQKSVVPGAKVTRDSLKGVFEQGLLVLIFVFDTEAHHESHDESQKACKDDAGLPWEVE